MRQSLRCAPVRRLFAGPAAACDAFLACCAPLPGGKALGHACLDRQPPGSEDTAGTFGHWAPPQRCIASNRSSAILHDEGRHGRTADGSDDTAGHNPTVSRSDRSERSHVPNGRFLQPASSAQPDTGTGVAARQLDYDALDPLVISQSAFLEAWPIVGKHALNMMIMSWQVRRTGSSLSATLLCCR